jgi:hypothetical protein
VPDADSQSLLVVTTADSPAALDARRERGVVDSLVGKSVSAINVNLLKQNVQRLLKQLHEIVDGDDEGTHGVVLDQVTVSVQITADAQVALLGSAAGMEAQNGITLVLRRRP